MGIFLVDEGTWAVGFMALVFTIGLLGVGALGWYVVHCDTENRRAERDLLLTEGHATSRGPVDTPAVVEHSAGVAEATAVAPATDPPPAPVHRRRKGH